MRRTHRTRRGALVATLVTGAGLLGPSLASEPGSRRFYASTGAVAGTWAVGGVLADPDAGRPSRLRHPVATPVATGVGAFTVFYGAALVARRIPALERAVARATRHADQGGGRVLLTTLANGLGEEIFFRGAWYAAAGDRHPVASSTAAYTLATTTTRNPALVLAAAAMGTLFGLQRQASGSIQAPVITHLTWSALMLRFLPPLFRSGRGTG